MKQKYIRDGKSNKIIATIKESDDKEVLFDTSNKQLAFYDKKRDMTWTFSNKYVGRGNQLFRVVK